MKHRLLVISGLSVCFLAQSHVSILEAAPAKKATPSSKAVATAAKQAAAPAAAPAPKADAPKEAGKEGEMEFTIKGQSKDKLTVTKMDPPAAFNLEDIQNFPEDRLQPVLNNPITFEEGKDFSALMSFKNDQLVHPWLPDLDKAPFLQMKGSVDKAVKEWTFSVIDQNGATVYKQTGRSTPPAFLSWNGDDEVRGSLAVETVYIPQLSTVDPNSYHRTYMGQPIQFAAISYSRSGQGVIEVSTKKLFLENKTEFTKEGPLLLEKVADAAREDSVTSLTIEAYDDDANMARARQQALAKYFAKELLINVDQIQLASPQGKEKRGNAMAILLGKRG